MIFIKNGKEFIKSFNQNVVDKDFINNCKKASELFKKGNDKMIIDVEEDYLKWQHSDEKIHKADFCDLIEAYEKMQNITEEKIIEILLNKLDYAYCDNCGTTGEDGCEWCHRKEQNWSLGKPAAKEIAEQIINLKRRNKNG